MIQLALSVLLTTVQIEPTPGWVGDVDHRVGGVALGDANGDGHADIAAGNYSGGYPALPLNTVIFLHGAGGIETTASWTGDLEGHTTSLTWRRLSGNDTPQLLEVNGGASGHQSLMYSYDHGALGTYPTWASVGTGESGVGFAFGDVNGDGIHDLFIANQNYFDDAVNTGFVSSAGELSETSNWTSTYAGQFSDAVLIDLDGSSVETRHDHWTADGTSYLYWMSSSPVRSIRWLLVAGDNPGPVFVDTAQGIVQFRDAPPAGADVEISYEVSTAPDLVISGNPGGIFVHAHDGTSIPEDASVNLEPDAGYKVVLAADVDRDGDPDLIAAGANGTPLAIFPNVGGALTTPPWTSDEADLSADDAAVADLDGDGYPEIVIGRFCEVEDMYVFDNAAGVIESTPSVAIEDPECIASLTVGDANEDGRADIILGHAGAPLSIHHNTSMAPPAPTAAAVELNGVTLTITGSGWRAPVRVFLDDVELDMTTVVDSQTVLATAPSDLPDGAYDLLVVNPDLQAAVVTGTVAVHDGQPVVEDDAQEGCDCGAAPSAWLGLVLALFWRRRR